MEKAKTLNLAQRICAVMAECSTIKKEGRNRDQNYTYLREVDVADTIRPLLARYGIVVIPSVEHFEKTETGKTKSGATWWLTHITVKYTLLNADDPNDTMTSIQHAEALDTQDKGIYKASTNAQKYFYVRTFCLGSDDDVEKDDRPAEPIVNGHATPPRAMPQSEPPVYYNISGAHDIDLAAEWLEGRGARYNSELKVFVSKTPIKGADKYRVADPSSPAPRQEAPKITTADQLTDVEVTDKETGEVIPESKLTQETRAKIERLKGASVQ